MNPSRPAAAAASTYPGIIPYHVDNQDDRDDQVSCAVASTGCPLAQSMNSYVHLFVSRSVGLSVSLSRFSPPSFSLGHICAKGKLQNSHFRRFCYNATGIRAITSGYQYCLPIFLIVFFCLLLLKIIDF